MMEHRTLVLPVHDSFIVHHTRSDLLQHAMREAYAERMGREIGTKADTEWLEKAIPAEAYELDAEGAYYIEDTIADLSNGPDFAQYRKRQWDFLKLRGESWGRQHSFLTL